MKKTLLFIIAIIAIAMCGYAKLPNGFNKNYTLSGIYGADGEEIVDNGAAPQSRLIVVTTNFGFVQSSAMLTMNYGPVGQTTLSFDGYAGFQNGWYVYVQDMGIAGQNYLLISRDGMTLRYVSTWNGGNYMEYEAY